MDKSKAEVRGNWAKKPGSSTTDYYDPPKRAAKLIESIAGDPGDNPLWSVQRNVLLGGRPKAHQPGKGHITACPRCPRKKAHQSKAHQLSQFPMCTLSLNESGLKAILAPPCGKNIISFQYGLRFYINMRTALQSRSTFLGRAPLPLLWTWTIGSYMSPDR